MNTNNSNIDDYSIEKFKNDCNKAKEKFDDIEIPDKLDKVIESSVDRAYRKKRLKFIKPLSTVAACIFIFIFIVNVSPTFAAYLSEIPGFETLIKIISSDKGLRASVENGYAQKINKSYKSDNIELRIDDIIFDKRNLIITYSIKTEEEYDWINVYKFKLVDDKDNEIEYASHEPAYNEVESNYIDKGLIKINYLNNTDYIPSKLKFQCFSLLGSKIKDGTMKVIDGQWDIEFDIDKNKIKYVKPKEYNIDKKIELGKININFEYMNIYPTSLDVKYSVDTSSDYICEGFKDIYIEDNKGNIYKQTGGTDMKKDSGILTFEGNYFKNPKELTLNCNGVYLKPREDEYIVVDLKNKKVIDDCGYGIEYLDHHNHENYSPNIDNSNKESLVLVLKITDEQINKLNENNFVYLTSVEDVNNNHYEVITTGKSTDNEDIKNLIYEIEKIEPVPELLKLKLGRINKEITEPFNINIYH